MYPIQLKKTVLEEGGAVVTEALVESPRGAARYKDFCKLTPSSPGVWRGHRPNGKPVAIELATPNEAQLEELNSLWGTP